MPRKTLITSFYFLSSEDPHEIAFRVAAIIHARSSLSCLSAYLIEESAICRNEYFRFRNRQSIDSFDSQMRWRRQSSFMFSNTYGLLLRRQQELRQGREEVESATARASPKRQVKGTLRDVVAILTEQEMLLYLKFANATLHFLHNLHVPRLEMRDLRNIARKEDYVNGSAPLSGFAFFSLLERAQPRLLTLSVAFSLPAYFASGGTDREGQFSVFNTRNSAEEWESASNTVPLLPEQVFNPIFSFIKNTPTAITLLCLDLSGCTIQPALFNTLINDCLKDAKLEYIQLHGHTDLGHSSLLPVITRFGKYLKLLGLNSTKYTCETINAITEYCNPHALKSLQLQNGPQIPEIMQGTYTFYDYPNNLIEEFDASLIKFAAKFQLSSSFEALSASMCRISSNGVSKVLKFLAKNNLRRFEVASPTGLRVSFDAIHEIYGGGDKKDPENTFPLRWLDVGGCAVGSGFSSSTSFPGKLADVLENCPHLSKLDLYMMGLAFSANPAGSPVGNESFKVIATKSFSSLQDLDISNLRSRLSRNTAFSSSDKDLILSGGHHHGQESGILQIARECVFLKRLDISETFCSSNDLRETWFFEDLLDALATTNKKMVESTGRSSLEMVHLGTRDDFKEELKDVQDRDLNKALTQPVIRLGQACSQTLIALNLSLLGKAVAGGAQSTVVVNKVRFGEMFVKQLNLVMDKVCPKLTTSVTLLGHNS